VDPYVAVAKIRQEVPDVIMLDVEMPRMDGITFLEKIMGQHPIPVVICSTLDREGFRLRRWRPWKRARWKSSPNPKSPLDNSWKNPASSSATWSNPPPKFNLSLVGPLPLAAPLLPVGCAQAHRRCGAREAAVATR
jgi:hypothetical protein